MDQDLEAHGVGQHIFAAETPWRHAWSGSAKRERLDGGRKEGDQRCWCAMTRRSEITVVHGEWRSTRRSRMLQDIGKLLTAASQCDVLRLCVIGVDKS